MRMLSRSEMVLKSSIMLHLLLRLNCLLNAVLHHQSHSRAVRRA